MTTAARTRRFARTVGVALALVIVAACTAPPPPGGSTTTTSASEPPTTSSTTSTTTSAPSTTTTSAPTTTTTSEVPDPGVDEGFSVTLAGAFGDLEFNPSNSIVGLYQTNHGDHQELSVGIQDRVGDDSMTFTFATREGAYEDFEVGYYGAAQRWPFNEAGRPGISLSPLGFCSTEFGDFEIRAIRRTGPVITAIWITYQRYCGDSGPWVSQPEFGEIRIGYPVTAHEVSPKVVRWPGETERGFASYDVPIYVRPPADVAVEVMEVSVSGGHADDFPIRDNGCSGVVGPEGCVVRVGFEPQAPGPRHASLRVTTSSGTTEVSLDATAARGQSEWVLDIDYEEPSRPDDHLVMPNSATAGGPYELRSAAVGDDGLVWRASFYLSPPEPFVEGREYAWSPLDGPGLRMSLSHSNAACEIDRATASMSDLGFTGPDNTIALLDLAMEVHCRAAYGHTVRGQIRFHDRDDQTAPGVVTDVSAARDGDQVVLRWTNPDTADLAGVIIRRYTGRVAPGAPDAGEAVYFGDSNSSRVAAPDTGPVALAIWTYDHTGNVSTPYEFQIEP